MSKVEISRIDITDLIVVIALSIALLLAIRSTMMELAMSIASGLLGYIGGTVKSSSVVSRKHGDENGTTPEPSSKIDMVLNEVQNVNDKVQSVTDKVQAVNDLARIIRR